MPDWLDDYLEFTSLQEAPESFHFWCGVATIASVVNRRVWRPRTNKLGVTYFTDYPGQLSPMLIAGSGRAKKSTAINIAKPLMREAGVNVFDGKITPEALLAEMAGLQGGAVLTIVASELSAFLGKQSYNDGMIDILNKLNDCESHPYKTKKAVYDLSDKNVCLTSLSGSTPMNLSKAIPPQAQEHGFLSRYIWVYSEESGKIEALDYDEEDIDPKIVAAENEKRTSLIVRLRAFRQLNGKIRWGKSKWFREYYNAYMNSPVSEGQGWPTRRPSHLIRLATIVNISRGGGAREFSDSDWKLADRRLNELEAVMPKCFEFIGQHINAEQQSKIINILRDKTLTKSSELMYRASKFFPNSSAIREQIAIMQSAGIIGIAGNDALTQEPLWVVLREPY